MSSCVKCSQSFQLFPLSSFPSDRCTSFLHPFQPGRDEAMMSSRRWENAMRGGRGDCMQLTYLLFLMECLSIHSVHFPQLLGFNNINTTGEITKCETKIVIDRRRKASSPANKLPTLRSLLSTSHINSEVWDTTWRKTRNVVSYGIFFLQVNAQQMAQKRHDWTVYLLFHRCEVKNAKSRWEERRRNEGKKREWKIQFFSFRVEGRENAAEPPVSRKSLSSRDNGETVEKNGERSGRHDSSRDDGTSTFW